MFCQSQVKATGTVAVWGAALCVTAGQLSDADAAGGRRSLAEKLMYGPGLTNHPVRVFPSGDVTVPSDWPLEPDGSIGCGTCHTALPSLSGGSDPLLRGLDSRGAGRREFCANCHTNRGMSSAQASHWMAVPAAHLGTRRTLGSRISGGGLDAESRTCLSCHDGANAPDIGPSGSRHLSFRSYSDMRANHPIGMSYPPPDPRKLLSSYRPASLLPDDVRLPGGRVSCVSCHDLYGRDDGLLTVPIANSELCMTCHDM